MPRRMKENNDVYLCQNRYKDDEENLQHQVLPDMQYKSSPSQNRSNFTHQSFSSQIDKLYHHPHTFNNNRTYYYQLRTYRQLQLKNRKFMCLNTYLSTCAHIPTTTRCLSIYQSSRLSRKLVIKVTEMSF